MVRGQKSSKDISWALNMWGLDIVIIATPSGLFFISVCFCDFVFPSAYSKKECYLVPLHFLTTHFQSADIFSSSFNMPTLDGPVDLVNLVVCSQQSMTMGIFVLEMEKCIR